jgi:acyl transferase domain-containing protein/acyl carrier protein
MLERSPDRPVPVREPVAIIGMGCRFPGASGPEAFWRVLRDAQDTLGEYLPGRFPFIDSVYAGTNPAGKVATRAGGFLPGLDMFDTEFFGISPREAAFLDPQLRMLFEVSWEAVEDAGIPREQLAGSTTGVFMALWTSDYELALRDGSTDLDFHSTLGTGRYSASGRLSYFLDLRGPSITVDTACSSSLVAIHLACRSLWSGESEMALAGGANAILRPEISLIYSRAGMLSPDGRSKFGDASANGYVRSEGAGVLVLKPLSKALAAGDRIDALIRGSAMNNDGQSSGLLISPSREAQSAVLRLALADADIGPESLDFVEAHGTGTPVGDPVELEAIGRVMAESVTRSTPCRIGSVKTNIGHVESAAGVAGVMKVALALYHGLIPASLHFRVPNPRVPWAELPIEVPVAPVAWPDRGTPRYGGVCGLGITGTNAHVVLESSPHETGAARVEPPADVAQVLCLSAHTEAALRAQADQWADRLASTDAPGADLCYTAARRRTHLEHRLAVVARGVGGLNAQLAAWRSGEPAAGVVQGRVRPVAAWKTVFVFSGAGGQSPGMGRQLSETEPVFRQMIEGCAAAVERNGGLDLLAEIDRPAETSRLGSIDVLQPPLWAVQVALAALWSSWGVRPDAVIGHSMGEVAAAVVAGALSLDDGAAVICDRSRLMGQAAGNGRMAVVGVSAEEIVGWIARYRGRVSVAGVNGPRTTILSGDREAIDDLLTRLSGQDLFCRRINVDIASHSAQMDAIRPAFEACLSHIEPVCPHIPFYSTVTGNVARFPPDARYWGRNLRQPVLFWPALERLIADQHNVFVEIGPHPVLLHSIEEAVRGGEAVAVPSTRRDGDESVDMRCALAALHAAGFPVDFRYLYPQGRVERLPLYPWQRDRHWIEVGDHASQSDPGRLLGAPIESSIDPGTWLWMVRRPGVDGTFIADALVEAAPIFAPGAISLTHVEFCSEFEGELQLAVTQTRRFQVAKRTDSGWRVCCRGDIGPIASVEPVLAAAVEPSASADRNVDAGPFNGDSRANPGPRLLALPPEPVEDVGVRVGIVHGTGDRGTTEGESAVDATEDTSLLDRVRAEAESLAGCSCLLSGIDRLDIVTSARASRLAVSAGLCGAEIVIHGELRASDGTLTARLEGARFRPVEAGDAGSHLYALSWKDAELSSDPTSPKTVFVIASDESARERLEAEICRVAIRLAPDAARATDVVCLCSRPIDLVHAVRAISPGSPRFWAVTHRALSVEPDDELELGVSPATGLAAALRREHPELHCCHVDMGSTLDVGALAGLIAQGTPEETIALRGTALRTPRFERLAAGQNEISFRGDATYLVTGGLGGVGLVVARWLAQHGAGHIVLVSRRGCSATVLEIIKEICATGADVRVIPTDIADPHAVERMLATVRESLPPLRGVFHAAALVEDSAFDAIDDEAMRRVLDAKVTGAWNLHKQTDRLDFFVLFSSLAATLTQPGQGMYSAANSAIDALAAARRRLGLPAISIQWAGWAETGLSTTGGAQRNLEHWLHHGIRPLSEELALQSLGIALNSDASCLLAAPIAWEKFVLTWEPFPRIFVTLINTLKPAARDDDCTLRDALETARPGTQVGVLAQHLRDELAWVLKTSPTRIDVHKPFGAYGLDSLLSLEFVRRLARSLGLKVPVTAVFNYPTIATLADELAHRLGFEVEPQNVVVGLTASADVLPEVTGQLTEDEAVLALIGNSEGAHE